VWPNDITAGPDGALWFTDSINGSIDRITTDGDVTVFTDANVYYPQEITVGPDGALWFTNDGDGETIPDSIGRITTAGVITTFPDDSIGVPYGITSGPDGAIWFANLDTNSIGQLTLTPHGHVPGAPTVTTASAGDGKATVSFTPGAGGVPATTGYVASCDPTDGGPSHTTSGSRSPIVVAGLTNGDDYTCTVFAFNDAGNSPRSAPSDVLTPSHGPSATVDCTDTTTCVAAVPTPPSKSAPGENVSVSGTPSDTLGSVTLSSSIGNVGCTTIGAKQRLIHSLTDRGFAPTTRLTVSVTLKIASATSSEGVCFSSTVPFRSRAHPTTPTAGSGYLLTCSQAGNIAPCVTSSKQVGANIVVTFVVLGGDPRFCVTLPKGRLQWLGGSAQAKVGTPFNAQLQSTGGKAPVHWKLTSGKLPAGLGLNGTTGSISGKPKNQGAQTAVIAGTDSASPPSTAKLSVPITVK